MLEHPLASLRVLILFDAPLECSANRHSHHVFDFIHPFLDVLFVGVDYLYEIHPLFFGRKHRMNLLILVELDSVDVFEDLFEMGLDCSGLLGLRQNFQQFVIGKEVETGKLLSFLLQIVV